jgi:hypothetical protein
MEHSEKNPEEGSKFINSFGFIMLCVVGVVVLLVLLKYMLGVN